MILPLHPEIRRYAFIEIVQGILVLLFGTVILIFRSEQSDSLLKCLVIGFLLLGCFLTFIRPRWYLRASWVFNNIEPIPATIVLHPRAMEGSKQLYAEVSLVNSSINHRILKVMLLADTNTSIGINNPQQALIYLDPVPTGPIIIKVDEQILWPAPTQMVD